MIEVLLLHRRLGRDAVLAGIRAALGAGSVAADVVAIEARKHATTAGAGDGETFEAAHDVAPRRSRAAVVTLGARRTALPADGRPTPSVADYDQLLTRPGAGGPPGREADDAASGS